MLVAVTVISALSLAFAPVSLFFLVTAPNYEFYKLLNVGILMLTGVVGLTVLLDGMRSLNRQATAGEAPPAPPQMVPGQPFPVRPPAQEEQPVNMGLLRIWVLLFGFVGTQLAWTLRPFVGHPDEELPDPAPDRGQFLPEHPGDDRQLALLTRAQGARRQRSSAGAARAAARARPISWGP